MSAYFKERGWKIPSDFHSRLDFRVEPIFSGFIFLCKTKNAFYERLNFSEVWTFVLAYYTDLVSCDKFLLAEIILSIDHEWTNYMIEVNNAKNKAAERRNSANKS